MVPFSDLHKLTAFYSNALYRCLYVFLSLYLSSYWAFGMLDLFSGGSRGDVIPMHNGTELCVSVYVCVCVCVCAILLFCCLLSRCLCGGVVCICHLAGHLGCLVCSQVIAQVTWSWCTTVRGLSTPTLIPTFSPTDPISTWSSPSTGLAKPTVPGLTSPPSRRRPHPSILLSLW